MSPSANRRTTIAALAAGFAIAVAAHNLFVSLFLWKLRRDVECLNRGDYAPLLANYAGNAILRFSSGAHRFAGEHHGKPAIERFLRDFVAAGLRGKVRALWIGGPPWALTLVARFDDEATGPGGEQLYANRTVIVARTRWGKIVEQDDFYEDTARIDAFERKLRELGISPWRD